MNSSRLMNTFSALRLTVMPRGIENLFDADQYFHMLSPFVMQVTSEE